MPSPRLIVALAAASLLPLAAAHAHPQPHPAAPQPSHAPQTPEGAGEAVDAFHAALARGDTAKAAAQLADAVLIFEAGGVERSRAEYAAGHLVGDAAFAQAVGSQMTRRAGGGGDLAWVASEGRAKGRFKDRDVDRVTTETMVLRREGAAWKIVHVHWSSRAAPAAP